MATKKPAKKSSASTTRKSTAAAKKPAAAPRAPKNDAITLLKDDHARVRKMFKQYEKLVKNDAANNEKKQLAATICLELTVHAKAEEEIFYPAARSVLKDEDLVDEADVEHASAKDLIAQIQSSSPADDHFDAKVKVLGEYINHHVEEEEGEMFPKVRKAKLDTAAVGARLAARKAELMRKGAR